jgi:hypothetical protein
MRPLLLLFCLLAVQACRHPLVIIGEGDIVDLNGSSYGCTLEQFNAGDIACTGFDFTEDYIIKYEGVPRPGWRFVRWDGPCKSDSIPPFCELSAPLSFSLVMDVQFPGLVMPATTAVFERTNIEPLANAGPDQSVNEQSVVSLDALSSSDPDGTIASYSWSQIAGTAVALSDATSATPVFTSQELTLASSLLFELTVTDNMGLAGTDTVVITVNPVNALPEADAGLLQTVSIGTVVSLDAANSTDGDGSIVGYQWLQTGGTSVELSNAETAVATFSSPAVSEFEQLIFLLTVTDNEGGTDTDTVVVIAKPPNVGPIADAARDQSVAEQTLVTLDASASIDIDGRLTFAWQRVSGEEVTLSDATAENPTFISPVVLVGEEPSTTFRLTATDGDGVDDTDDVVIRYFAVNAAPVADAGSDQTIPTPRLVTLDGSASNDMIDGSISSYSWMQLSGTPVELTGADTSMPTFRGPRLAIDDDLIFELTVTDNETATATDSVTITISGVETQITGLQATAEMNDTAIQFGGDYPSGNNLDCMGENPLQQDCASGRDSGMPDNMDGQAGFRFTRLDAAGLMVGEPPEISACVRDEVTGLVWEVKTDDETIHDADFTYRWGGKTAISNAGGTYYSDWDLLVDGSNTETLCGYSDWRVPTRKELESILSHDRGPPMIDTQYFRGINLIDPMSFWTANPSARDDTRAWAVQFHDGLSNESAYHRADTPLPVRLVRGNAP